MKNFRVYVLTFSLLIVISCIKEDVSNIGSDVNLQPEYAIPFGVSEYLIQDFVGDYFFQFPIDTSLITDYENLIQFDSLFYYSPSSLSFALFTPLGLTALEESTNQITSIMIRTNVNNSIPSKVNVQVYFVDYYGEILDSLYNEGPLTIESAKVDAEGNVVEASELLKHDTYVDEESIDQLINASSLKIDVSLLLEDTTGVIRKFNSDQALTVQLASQIKLDISTNEQ